MRRERREGTIVRVLSLATAVAIAMPMAPMAQDKPSFAGTWTFDASKSDAPPAGRGGRGGGRGGRGLGALGGGPTGPVVIAQSETEITIGAVTYKLDGSTSSVGRGGAAQAKARWDGAALVIETTRDLRGNTITTKEVRRLAPGAKEMTVEITVNAPRGEQKVKQVFTRTG